MNVRAPFVNAESNLPSIIDRASAALSNAPNSAEIVEAKDAASLVYDLAKRAARIGKAQVRA
jgi:hypothetical protein